jgi:hypothetical protein
MDLSYWTHEDYFIFKPDFNGSITNYLDIIKPHSKLVFSNFGDLNLCIEQDNFYPNNFYLDKKYIGSKFDQPLANSLDQLINMTHINFGYKFNYPLSKSLNQLRNLTHIYFGYWFNKPLGNSLDKLINLTHLTFSEYFNRPSNIKILALNCNNKNLIDSLPNSIEQLNFDYCFNLPLDNLPSSIKKISFEKEPKYDNPLNNLPKSLEQLELPSEYKFEIKNIPTNCKIIYL